MGKIKKYFLNIFVFIVNLALFFGAFLFIKNKEESKKQEQVGSSGDGSDSAQIQDLANQVNPGASDQTNVQPLESESVPESAVSSPVLNPTPAPTSTPVSKQASTPVKPKSSAKTKTS